jgi:DnaJ-domain-containing protein 1
LAEDPITLEELAEEFGVSRERVRQIEVRTYDKVQKAMRNRVAAIGIAAHPARVGVALNQVATSS